MLANYKLKAGENFCFHLALLYLFVGLRGTKTKDLQAAKITNVIANNNKPNTIGMHSGYA